MTLPQIVSLLAAAAVAAMYLRDLLPANLFAGEAQTLTHIRNVLAIRDAYKTPEVATRCNALMEALLGIKP
jgi:hypothetical protein